MHAREYAAAWSPDCMHALESAAAWSPGRMHALEYATAWSPDHMHAPVSSAAWSAWYPATSGDLRHHGPSIESMRKGTLYRFSFWAIVTGKMWCCSRCWCQFIGTRVGEASKPGPWAGLEDQDGRFDEALLGHLTGEDSCHHPFEDLLERYGGRSPALPSDIFAEDWDARASAFDESAS